MLNLLTKYLIAINIGVLSSLPYCSARIITIEFSAEVTEASATGSLVDSIHVGDLIRGVYAYDVPVPDVLPVADVAFGGDFYGKRDVMVTRPSGICLFVNGNILKTNPENVNMEVKIYNDRNFVIPSPPDQMILTSTNNLAFSSYEDLHVGNVRLFFADDTATALREGNIPVMSPNLDDWDIHILEFSAWQGSLGRRGSGEPVNGNSVSVKAEIISTRLLPNPAWLLHVNSNADTDGDGLSWLTPYRSLQDAIENAPTVGNTLIRVAQGIYRPDDGQRFMANDPEASFKLYNGIIIAGGYSPPSVGWRSPSQCPTILSGISSNSGWCGHNPGFSHTRHVVYAENVDQTAVLDGCTIRDGYADGSTSDMNESPIDFNACGAGMLLVNAGPLIRNCIFQGNVASQYGGGLCSMGGKPKLVDCEFAVNESKYGGGGVYCDLDGIYGLRCLFEGNLSGYGAAVFNLGPSIWENCTYVGNLAWHDAAILFTSSDPNGVNNQIINCILKNSGQELTISGTAEVEVTYSNVKAGWPGLGNINKDPCFVMSGYWDPNVNPEDPNDDYWVKGNYHLKSESGHLDRKSHFWVIDSITSPCIDKGDPNMPVGDEPLPNGSRINMGVYGGTIEASKSKL